ncbi:hypothetical protein FA09DRAFT_47595 [Tilletiopsis washingtonensis]|uniref:CRAL-TRIO domain-containing protein n=1 Tax=Tilletiopsis washingtonensis TaxID=58919 RepID=A0A316Z8J6_9BASI|nr:hypothetical protein FA09DRAFT_47595 [Tilletiopsis washingtonensis]PWN97262.1 hypothetical protein FA09DRAFT_47595 [Tilletiopsis washingtonensis]
MGKEYEIPNEPVPALPGYVGNLTDEQEQKLREIWQGYFDTCEKATGSKKGAQKQDLEALKNQKAEDDKAKADPKNSGIAKDDKAKDAAKEAEEAAALKALMDEYGGEALRDAYWKFVKGDSPDTAMLRFLRARKWDVSRALAMLCTCMKWRLDNDVEALQERGDAGNEQIPHFLEQQRSGKTYALGTAINEQPICYIHVRKHLTFGQPSSSMEKYVIYAMESFRLLMQPPNDKVVLMFDLTGFGLKNMDWNCILYIVKCLEAFYPESLGTLYIHNAPWIFKGIWMVLGPLLDPVVRSKVVFSSKATDIEGHIPPSRLIADLGGNVTTGFEFTEPQDGENDLLKNEGERKKRFDHFMELADEFEEVTRKWSKGGSAEDEEKRNLLVLKLRVAQFELEPYTRGTTVAHRQHIIDGQGIVKWRYEQKDGDTQIHVVGRRACAATLRREIAEVENGSSLKEAQEKSEKALEAKDWATLYGDEKTAQLVEGGKYGEVVAGTLDASDAAGAAAGAATGAAAGGAAAAATSNDDAAPAAAEPVTEEFKDAPEASAAHAESVPAVQPTKEQEAQAAVEPEPAPKPAATKAEAPADTPTKEKSGLGRRFSKLMSKVAA